MKYRLLLDGETVVETDEFLSDDCTYWIAAGKLVAGAIYSAKRDTPCRRVVAERIDRYQEALKRIVTDYAVIDCRTWRTAMREIQELATTALAE